MSRFQKFTVSFMIFVVFPQKYGFRTMVQPRILSMLKDHNSPKTFSVVIISPIFAIFSGLFVQKWRTGELFINLYQTVGISQCLTLLIVIPETPRDSLGGGYIVVHRCFLMQYIFSSSLFSLCWLYGHCISLRIVFKSLIQVWMITVICRDGVHVLILVTSTLIMTRL